MISWDEKLIYDGEVGTTVYGRYMELVNGFIDQQTQLGSTILWGLALFEIMRKPPIATKWTEVSSEMFYDVLWCFYVDFPIKSCEVIGTGSLSNVRRCREKTSGKCFALKARHGGPSGVELCCFMWFYVVFIWFYMF